MPGEPLRGPITKGPAPAPVQNAVRLMLVQAALSVLGFIVLLATKDTLRKEIAKKNTSYDTTKLDDVVNAAVTIGIVIGLIFTVLYILLALQVGKGKNWARIVTWVLASLGAVAGLASFAQPEPALSRILSILGLAIDIAIIVLLAQRLSNDYFRRRV
jgi:O-antigen/teichoic acid export membrane protein